MKIIEKTRAEVSKEAYEAFVVLSQDSNFIKWKEEVVDSALRDLDRRIHSNPNLRTKEGQFEAAVDILVEQKVRIMVESFFKVAEKQANFLEQKIQQMKLRQGKKD